MKSTNDLSVLKQRLRLLQSLRAGLRLGKGRFWIRLDSNKTYDMKHGQYPTIKEILGINREDMATANGKKKDSNAWRRLFKPCKPLSKGFIYGELDHCGFISVEAVEDGEQQDDGASPVHGNKVDKALAETIKKSCANA